MRIYDVSDADIQAAARDAGVVIPRGRSSVVIRPDHAFPKDARPWVKYSGSGRNSGACCWHGHYAFMMAIFNRNENARIVTALAKYHGVADFRAKADKPSSQAWDSKELCECDSMDIVAMERGSFWQGYSRIPALDENFTLDDLPRVRVLAYRD